MLNVICIYIDQGVKMLTLSSMENLIVQCNPNMVSVTSASRYHTRYQSRSSMYIRSMLPQNFAELAEAVLIDTTEDL